MMILVLGLIRLRDLAQIVSVSLISALILIISQTLFAELSAAIGAYPGLVMTNPAYYLNQGLVGWLALLVMPCGWLAPVFGLYLAQRWRQISYEMS
ncbi:MAG: hypothetical protein GY803_29445 [Chloroflexi bacterium]|nr:hypothetical protein [Chloroflexota bacterium]